MFYHNAGSETKNTDDSIICSTLIQVMIRKQDFVSRRNVIFSVFTLFLRRFHYVCFTTCFRLENIVYHQNFHAINFLLFIISIALLIIFCITTANTVAPAITKTLVTTYCNQPLPRIRLSFNFSTTRKITIWDR